VIINLGDGTCGSVPAPGVGWIGAFIVEVLPECPNPSNLDFQLAIIAANGFTATLDFEMPVGGWFDDLEEHRGWMIGAPDDDATTGIWERVDPIGTTYDGHVIQMEDDHTPSPGSLCFVTGNGAPGGAAGDNDVDSGKTTLLTPVFDLADALTATVSYWRWYTNSWGNSPDQDWWDVQVTSDGQVWVTLEHTQQTQAVWTQQTFDLSQYIPMTDHVQLRFVASDEGSGSLVEAGVDDFLLTVVRTVVTGADESTTEVPQEFTLTSIYPNPFNPRTTISFELPSPGPVKLSVYDLSGRCVVTLVSQELQAGHHEVIWQGRDENNRSVASGLYFGQLEAKDKVQVRKMLLLR
jgi:hypothetical protein